MSTLNDPSFISCNTLQGCTVPVGNGTCGETCSLEIMKEFNKLYEERMNQIDCEVCGDCSQEKIQIQQEWIKNLMQQNEMLVTVVQELEYEATERVQQLEEKLHKSAECLCEGEKMLNEKERTVQELTQRLIYYGSFGDIDEMARELQCTREECQSLKQKMANMREALTEEVAAKHDQIILLKKDLEIFEDRCMQADKQTAFKENIIRELRKEVKQLKQQVSIPEKPLNLSQRNIKHTQVSYSKLNKPNSQENIDKPYKIVRHSSKKQVGNNTVLYINKDGSVHKDLLDSEQVSSKSAAELKSKNHADICLKCKNKLKHSKSFFPNCKSENDLINVKNMLKPVKPRSILTKPSLGRSKTFVDQTKRVLNEIEFDELYSSKGCCVPVKCHIDYLEKRQSQV